MEKQRTTVNFEKQVFDDLDVNLYEIVIAVSRMAREINDKAHKFLNPSQEVNPVTLALRRLDNGAGFSYENGDGAAEAPSGEV